ncbi:hypothetical protein [Streptosporangium saharense]|uniref:ABC-type uncharacterized transport system ATPase component n=1 Tax=Streptosporangium saharense TaxID=1706840 RepID=A0A7W7QPJ5_9ACTN|nr:hypothetical protein [Streptosporangium saharense]MBB4917407.1 ABC-type uncharacterized transport system ATPase component [Streptosporangium saharense]
MLSSEPSAATYSEAVEAILDALDDRDLTTAREHFRRAVHGNPAAVTGLLKFLAAAVTIPAGLVVVGAGIDIWANPHRADWAWRCGDCPWTGSNYRSLAVARSAAQEHAHDHQSGGAPVPVVVEYGSDPHTEKARR